MIISLYSDNCSQGVMETEHSDGSTTAERFRSDWSLCLEKAKEDAEWNVSDVQGGMVELGWIMREVDEVIVEY